MSAELKPGDRLGPYELFNRVELGGPRDTWRAYEPRRRRYVMLRLLPRQAGASETWLARFRHGAQALARLNHPNLLRLEDFGEQDGQAYLVSPLLEGMTLDYLLGEPWPLPEALLVLEPLASALDYAHGRHVYHRAVRPSEVLVTEEGQVVLIGFGSDWMDREGETTPDEGPAEDLRGFGAIAFELLVGRPPFPDESWPSSLQPHFPGAYERPCSLPATLPQSAVTAFFRALAPEARLRFVTAGGLVRELAAELEPAQPPPYLTWLDASKQEDRRARPTWRQRLATVSWRRRLAAVAAAVAVVLLAEHLFVEPALALLAGRGGQAAVTLASGQVLLAGGCANDPSGDRLASLIRNARAVGQRELPGLLSTSLLFDSRRGWLLEPRLTQARCGAQAVLLESGAALVVGGLGPDDQPLPSAERFDPAIGQWSPAGRLWIPRREFSAVELGGGQAFVIGGLSGGATREPIGSVERFDAASNNWSLAPGLSLARRQHSATRLPGGQVLVVGGLGKDGGVLAAAERWERTAGAWQPVGELRQGRARHTATALRDSRILVVGGSAGRGLLGSAELYDPRTTVWSRAGTLSEPRAEHSATLLADGQVLVVGGLGVGGALASVERYDPATGTWRRAAGLPEPRYGHSATLLQDGRLLVAGGRAEQDGAYLGTTLLYDPERDAWEAGPALVW